MADFQPATAQEIHLVHSIAVARWRTFLVQEAEKRALDKTMAGRRRKLGTLHPYTIKKTAATASTCSRPALRADKPGS
jgi:hypothetical protein